MRGCNPIRANEPELGDAGVNDTASPTATSSRDAGYPARRAMVVTAS
ncbi:hypothetical protein [Alloactinosynnema sp. L-07]|nr:hypothetical protein [Alloactinosynnema sp. L-07]CRK60473.1 hypothetical protein [Alloactinosynnema sp. L-07]